MHGVLQDFRLALRMLRTHKVWSATIVLILGLGIGGNMAMLSAFDAWVLRPLDFERPEQLVALEETQPALGRSGYNVSAADLEDWRERATLFAGMEPFSRRLFNLRSEDDPERIQGARVSAGLFPLLGKQPVIGRTFSDDEDLPGQPARVALVSTRLWRDRLGADPQLVGRTVLLDDEPYEVIGIMEEGFAFPEYGDVWVPMGLDPSASPRDRRWLDVFARLRPGVSVAQADEEIRAIAGEIARLHPESHTGWSAQASPLRATWTPAVIKLALTASAGAALLVLLVICANVANLLLARALARQKETALRSVLGAGRWRLLRQALAEAGLLASLGTLLGVPLGIAMIRWMLSWAPAPPPYLFEMRLDHRAVPYTVLLTLLVAVVSGLVPILSTTGRNVFGALKSGSRASGSRSVGRLRSSLVGLELALSAALLVGALLMVKTFVESRGLSQGYRTAGVWTTQVSLTSSAYADAPRRPALLERATAELLESTGVSAVGWADILPASPGYDRGALEAEGLARERGEEPTATWHRVQGDYFDVLDIPLVAGRAFRKAEMRDGAAVALVSEGLATELGGTAVGRRIRSSDPDTGGWLRIVGVVGDVDPGSDMVQFGDVPKVQVYLPYGSAPVAGMNLVARFDGPSTAVAEAIRAALRRADPSVPVGRSRSLAQAVDEVYWTDRFFSQLLSLYAAVALAIAAVGVYGVATEAATRRRGEMAIRLALGARRRDLLRLLVGHGVLLGGLGILVGLALAALSTRFGSAMLHGASATDPVIFLGVALLLVGVVAAANWLPALRAARTDPATALRCE